MKNALEDQGVFEVEKLGGCQALIKPSGLAAT
jgi:hypothetical protein